MALTLGLASILVGFALVVAGTRAGSVSGVFSFSDVSHNLGQLLLGRWT